jgi:hypothetical protein
VPQCADLGKKEREQKRTTRGETEMLYFEMVGITITK